MEFSGYLVNCPARDGRLVLYDSKLARAHLCLSILYVGSARNVKGATYLLDSTSTTVLQCALLFPRPVPFAFTLSPTMPLVMSLAVRRVMKIGVAATTFVSPLGPSTPVHKRHDKSTLGYRTRTSYSVLRSTRAVSKTPLWLTFLACCPRFGERNDEIGAPFLLSTANVFCSLRPMMY